MLFTLQGAEISGTKWRRAQGFSEDFWQPLASASALCAFPWHVIPLLLWTSKGDAFPHRNWVHSLYPRVMEPVHYLVKTVQNFWKSQELQVLCPLSFPLLSASFFRRNKWLQARRWEKREFLFSKYVNFNLFLWLAALFLVPFVFCAILAEHIVLTLCVSLVVWLFLFGHYDFFQSCVGTCQWVRCLIVTLVHLAPASNFSLTDLDSETFCTGCCSLKCEQPCLLFQLMYIEPLSNFGLCIWYAGTRSCFYKFVMCYTTDVTKTNSRVLVNLYKCRCRM